jgi:hypothetical protein
LLGFLLLRLHSCRVCFTEGKRIGQNNDGLFSCSLACSLFLTHFATATFLLELLLFRLGELVAMMRKKIKQLEKQRAWPPQIVREMSMEAKSFLVRFVTQARSHNHFAMNDEELIKDLEQEFKYSTSQVSTAYYIILLHTTHLLLFTTTTTTTTTTYYYMRFFPVLIPDTTLGEDLTGLDGP